MSLFSPVPLGSCFPSLGCLQWPLHSLVLRPVHFHTSFTSSNPVMSHPHRDPAVSSHSSQNETQTDTVPPDPTCALLFSSTSCSSSSCRDTERKEAHPSFTSHPLYALSYPRVSPEHLSACPLHRHAFPVLLRVEKDHRPQLDGLPWLPVHLIRYFMIPY